MIRPHVRDPAEEPATILCADFRETLRTVAEMGGADLVATSPPYCDARAYDSDVMFGDDDYRALGDAVFAALKPGGHALINLDAPVREWRPGIGSERGLHPWRMAIDWSERVGFRFVERLAFARFGVPGEYRGRFRNDWEPLLWFQRPGVGFFDKTGLTEAAVSGSYAGNVAVQATRNGHYTRRATGTAAEHGLRHRGTLWQYGTVGRGHTGSPELEAAGHPARWPLRLALDIVACFSPAGGLVCDPFVGAGTTAVAAVRLGRGFVGGDISERWADVARDIVGRASAQQVML